MNTPATLQPGRWLDGALPENVLLGPNTVISGDLAFKRFRSQKNIALVVGQNCTLDGVHFAFGENAHAEFGNYCCFCNAVLLCELEIRIGNHVLLGWNVTIADTDFHPLSPAQRVADAVACSPLGGDSKRPLLEALPVVIEDDVWVGPSATILKGVHIGAGSFIEPGALVTRDVPSRSRVAGNPARVIGAV
jgi:acetyltransferase-like isoleucine patch superfamily enzyme